MQQYDKFFDALNYLSDIDYLINTMIREYDLSKANINALLYTGRITQEQYNNLNSMPKLYRERQIGYMIKSDRTIYDSIKQGIIQAKRMFAKENNIASTDILAIKNDALFVINKIPMITKFDIYGSGSFNFKLKNIYSSYYRYKSKSRSKIELYYVCDKAHNIEALDVKGISESNLELHKDYFMDFLLAVFYSAQNMDIKDTLNIIKSFYVKYISLELDLGYYRAFNADSCFHIKRSGNMVSMYRAEHLPDTPYIKNNIDISYNIDIIMYLQKIFSNLYFSKNKY